MRQRGDAIDGDRTVAAFESDGEILSAATFADLGKVGAVPEDCGEKFGVEDGVEFW
jgi:hypothetical protein